MDNEKLNVSHFEAMWTMDLRMYRISVRNGEDPVESGVIIRLDDESGVVTPVGVLIDDAELSAAVISRMLRAGAAVERWD